MRKIFILLLIFLITLASCTVDEDKEDNNNDIINTDVEINIDNNSQSEPEIIYDNFSEILEIESFDGYTLKGRLTLPGGEKNISKLVIYVNGSGPNVSASDAHWFCNFFAEEFSNRGIAFFSYNSRGIDMDDGTDGSINYETYQTYLPLNSVEDIYYMISAIKANERLKDCKVYLSGWSEGTIISTLVAEKYPNMVDALFSVGYVNENMKDILIWQNTGGPSMVWYRAHFDADEQGRITKEAYEADPKNVISSILQNVSFENIDHNNDGYISEDDFVIVWKDLMGYTLEEILNAIEQRDDEWLKNNYGGGLIPLTSGWFLEHFSLKSNMEVMPTLDLPIYIFQGELDQNCGTDGVYAVRDKFAELNKNNLTIHIFESHDHGLNSNDILNGEIPAGIQALINTIENMQ